MLSCYVSAAETDATQQPTQADYKEGEKWGWKYKGVTTGGEVRAEGKEAKVITNQKGVLSMLTESGTIPLSSRLKAKRHDTTGL